MQQVLSLMKSVRPPHESDPEIVSKLPTFRASLRHAINRSGLTQDEIAVALEIDPASFSRMVREPRHVAARPREFPNEKLTDFVLVTGSMAPIQWQALRLGRELVAARETRIQRLERELAAERARAYQAIHDEVAAA